MPAKSTSKRSGTAARRSMDVQTLYLDGEPAFAVIP